MAGEEQSIVAEMLRESLQYGASPSLTVVSNSMSPLLRSGDQVVLSSVGSRKIEVGQIITFVAADSRRLITHRVAGSVTGNGNSTVVTFGDRSLLFDPPVAVEDVIGQVVCRRRKGRNLDLNSGRGAWLNEKLMRLARENLEKVTGLAKNEFPANSDSAKQCNETCRQRRASTRMRVYLRLRYYWAMQLIFLAVTPLGLNVSRDD